MKKKEKREEKTEILFFLFFSFLLEKNGKIVIHTDFQFSH
jgi:hypothetical protein